MRQAKTDTIKINNERANKHEHIEKSQTKQNTTNKQTNTQTNKQTKKNKKRFGDIKKRNRFIILN